MSDGFYGPRSRENARLLVDAAASLGVDKRLIRTQAGGYLVPVEVLDFINGEGEHEAEEKVEEKRPSQADSKADWLAYAEGKGLSVTDENTKAEIVEAVKNAEEAND